MNITIEISLYPLTELYVDEVNKFIGLLQAHDFTVNVNALSTQVQGPYHIVWGAVGNALKQTFSSGVRGSLVMKVLPGDIDLRYQHPEV